MYKRILAALLSFLLLLPFNAYGGSVNISAQCAVAMDADTQRVLYDRAGDIRRSIASTTKIMTCLIACERGNMDDVVTITDDMLYGTEGTMIYLKPGDKITLGDLVKGALLASGNDAANAIAVHMSKGIDAFVDDMNIRAGELGMRNTHFETPSGLDKGEHYSTAYDMALLACAAVKNSLFSSICSMQSVQIIISNKSQTIYNHNKLLSYDKGYYGIKTGFTKKAGRCLVSAFRHKGSTIIVVTLNAPDDWNDHTAIRKYVVGKYTDYRDRVNISLDVVGGVAGRVQCSADISACTCGRVRQYVYYYPFVYAPVYKGDAIGRVDVYIDNIKIESVEITASESVEIWQATK